MATGGVFGGKRGKRLQRQRGEKIERNFAHQFDTGGMDRLYVRGIGNVHKKLLIQAAACNLALLMRSMYGAGKPKAAHDQAVEAIFVILSLINAISASSEPWYAQLWQSAALWAFVRAQVDILLFTRKSADLDTGC